MQLIVNVPLSNLLGLAFWLVAAVVIHDGILAPLTVAVGAVLTRLPAGRDATSRADRSSLRS